jgi:hypothetical protein
MHCQNCQNKVRCIEFMATHYESAFSAEFCNVIEKEIPHIAGLLQHSDKQVVRAGADILSKLSEQGEIH